MGRVKFYSTTDLAGGYYLKNAEKVISGFDCLRTDYTINDIVELYNIHKYIKKGLYLKDWTQEYIEKCIGYVKNFQIVIGRYFAKIENENIINEYLALDIDYRDDFWEMFAKYNVYERISNETIEKIMKLNEVSLSQILRNQIIVNRYGEVIKNRLLDYSGSVRIILDKYEMFHDRISSEIFLPVELTLKDKETIISNYIDLPEAHINILEIIQNIKNTKEFNISDKTRLKAKRRIKVERKKIFSDNSVIQMETEISFS